MLIEGYSKIYDYENLYQASIQASKEKRYKNSVLKFNENLEENLIQIQNELIWKTYELGPFFTFEKFEPKKRIISALPFRDRVVQIALCNIIEPHFEKHFIYDSYACRIDKGTHAAAKRLSYFLGKPDVTKYLKCDINKYFKSIDIDILQAIIRKRYIFDEDILWLINKILTHEYNNDGVKIGNRFSQLAANAFLAELDFELKVKRQIKYYLRYMDDFIILSNSKEKLKNLLVIIEDYLKNELKLTLNDKTTINNTKDGVDFVGYRVFPKNKIIKKQSMNRTRNVFKGWRNGKINDEDYLASISSRCGHATGTASYKFYNEILLKSLHIIIKRNRPPDLHS